MKKELPFYLLIVFIFSLLIAAYSNHFHNPFQFDDSHTIVNNASIRNIKNIPDFFKDARTFSSLPANQSYRPVVTTLNAVDYWMGGKEQPVPFYYHVSIFISYILLGILLYFLFLKIFNQTIQHTWNKYFALFGAGFYCLHTANAETVNYIIARTDSFSTLMVVLSFVIYLYKPQWRTKFIFLIPVVIGFFAKEPALMIAPLLFLYLVLFDYKIPVVEWFTFKGIKNIRTALFQLLPLFILCIALVVLSKKMIPGSYTPGGLSGYAYIITQPIVIVHYINNFVLPADLSADTDWIAISTLFNLRILMGFVFLTAFIILAVFCSTRQLLRPIAFGITWFLLALLPTSIIPLAEVLNDHRTFFPYIGLVLAATWGIGLILIRYKDRIEQLLSLKIIVIALPLLVLTVHAYGVHERNKIWNTEESLWKDVTLKSPNNARGLMNYGLARMRLGDYSIALSYFNRALKIAPDYSYIYINRGVAEAVTGMLTEAEDDYKKALALNDQNPESFYFYALFLKSQGRYKEALELANNGLKISADHIGNKTLSEELTALIANNGNQGFYSGQKIKNSPLTAEDYLNLSLTFYQNKLYQQCIDAAEHALKLKPDYAEAYNNICTANNMLGQWDKAIDAGNKGLKIKPNYALLKNNLQVAINGKTMRK